MASRKCLPPCEISKQRNNLLRISGMVLKSVVDKHCFHGTLDDTNPDVRNLLSVIENIFMHRFKGISKWFDDRPPISFWPCIISLCANLQRSCTNSIAQMDSRLSDLSRGRIFIQMALMERRLSEYISKLLLPESRKTMLKFYEPDAFLMKDEGAAFAHVCLGLNVIDFSFCPKGENLDYPYVPCIDFTPYLDFTPCAEAALDDEHEQAVLSGKTIRKSCDSVPSDQDDWKEKYQTLYIKYRELSQQKTYGDEMLSLKQSRIEKLELDLRREHQMMADLKASHLNESRHLQGVIMDLREDLASFGIVKNLDDRRRLEIFLTGLSKNGKFHEAIALRDIDPPVVPVDGASGTDHYESFEHIAPA